MAAGAHAQPDELKRWDLAGHPVSFGIPQHNQLGVFVGKDFLNPCSTTLTISSQFPARRRLLSKPFG